MSFERPYDLIIIGGFGHAGLPFGMVLADVGHQVGLYDIDRSKRAMIQAGQMPFLEHGSESMLSRVIGKTLHIVDDLSAVTKARLIVITIGTPAEEYSNPEPKPLFELGKQLVRHLHQDHCVMLRSTVAPGTSHYLNEFFKQSGHEIHLAFCPERIIQGYAIQQLRKLPQIISGFTEKAVRSVDALFKSLGVETVLVNVAEAELVKLFCNAWRYAQFAVANQFYMIATEQGLDYARIYRAMSHNYERVRDLPSPGFAAGPCLLKDTAILAASSGGNRFPLGDAAISVNEGLVNFIVDRLKKSVGEDLTNIRVGILGMAFKANSDDTRNSLSYKLAKMLRSSGIRTVCSDEYVKDPDFVTKEELLSSCCAVIIGAPHSVYKEIKVGMDTFLIDLWGIVKDRAVRIVT